MDHASEITLSKQDERRIAIMQLLSDPTRYKIVKILLSEEKLCVSDIANRLAVSVSAISQHFRSFESLGLVSKQRTGQKICYILQNPDGILDTLMQSK